MYYPAQVLDGFEIIKRPVSIDINHLKNAQAPMCCLTLK
jgi:hypothetical protein